MKIINPILSGSILLSIIIFLASCDHSVTIESSVHADGSIDRTVVLTKVDSNAVQNNMFGIHAEKGWEVESGRDKSSKQEKFIVAFRKHFTSAEEANAEMDTPADTLFRVRSGFEKKFRWFYTYINYSDTYAAINRFAKPDVSEYFTPEDFAFIDRLPAEGKSISHADSIYMERLNEKIYDVFAAKAFYDIYYDAMVEAGKKNNIEDRWIDTLDHHRDRLFRYLLNNENDFDDDFMLKFADSLQIPLSPEMKNDYEVLTGPIEKQINFMSHAGEGEYIHCIKMPWTVISTNADSVSGNSMYWRPPVARFLLRDYTMHAQARKLNYWVVGVSVIIIGFTFFIFIRKRKVA